MKPSKKMVTRGRLVLATFVLAIVGLTTALAIAQERGGASAEAPGSATAAPQHREGETAESEAAEGETGEGPHGGAAHAESHGPEDLNWTDIWDKKRPAIVSLVINFGVLMTLYYLLGRKPIANALKQRRATIGKDIEDAQKLLNEAKDRAKKYQGSLEDADGDAETATAALIASGKGEVERLLRDAGEKAERMKRDATRLVEQERKAVHQDLLEETVDVAVREAAQLLQKAVTAEDHARLAQDLLQELARRPAARAHSAPAGGQS